MSGVVNRGVAEKAMAVKADELVRKPFQPQDLIARVKSLLNPAGLPGTSLRDEEANAAEASRVLGGLFSAAPALDQPAAPPVYRAAPVAPPPFQSRINSQPAPVAAARYCAAPSSSAARRPRSCATKFAGWNCS